jgi:hypothetical protein
MYGSSHRVRAPSRLVRCACRGVKKNGGTVYLNAHVDQIIVEGGRARGVRLKGGDVIRASKAVVSNARCAAQMWDCESSLMYVSQVSKSGFAFFCYGCLHVRFVFFWISHGSFG